MSRTAKSEINGKVAYIQSLAIILKKPNNKIQVEIIETYTTSVNIHKL